MWCCRMSADVELQANSVERVAEFVALEQERREGVIPPAAWPSRDGEIVFDRLCARYAADLEPVLHDVSFTIRPRGASERDAIFD